MAGITVLVPVKVTGTGIAGLVLFAMFAKPGMASFATVASDTVISGLGGGATAVAAGLTTVGLGRGNPET